MVRCPSVPSDSFQPAFQQTSCVDREVGLLITSHPLASLSPDARRLCSSVAESTPTGPRMPPCHVPYPYQRLCVDACWACDARIPVFKQSRNTSPEHLYHSLLNGKVEQGRIRARHLRRFLERMNQVARTGVKSRCTACWRACSDILPLAFAKTRSGALYPLLVLS